MGPAQLRSCVGRLSHVRINHAGGDVMHCLACCFQPLSLTARALLSHASGRPFFELDLPLVAKQVHTHVHVSVAIRSASEILHLCIQLHKACWMKSSSSSSRCGSSSEFYMPSSHTLRECSFILSWDHVHWCCACADRTSFWLSAAWMVCPEISRAL